MRDAITAVGVVVPAHDEAELVAAALESVVAAAGRVDVPVEIVVVSNGSTDATSQVARARGATVLELPSAGVGAARALGAAVSLRGRDPRGLWLASTDADSRVPSSWLSHHLELADAGADVVLGTVCLDDHHLPDHAEWWRTYRHPIGLDAHPHVHGANLGVRGSTYVAAGGFADLDRDEDVDLVRRLRDVTDRIVTTDGSAVVTSARLVGRAVGGVADDLAGA